MRGRLRRRADSEAKRRIEPWGHLEWLASEELTGSSLTLGRVVIHPGRANPRHGHTACEEVLYLLSGRLSHSVGDRTVTMQAGDTLCVPAGVMHHAHNTGDEDAEMIVAYSSGRRDFRPERPSAASGGRA